MNKTMKFLFFLLLSTPVVVIGANEVRLLEDAYEVTRLEITVFDESSGQVRVAKCETCEQRTLRITEQTRVYKADREIPLEQADVYRGAEAVVFRDVDSDEVTRIMIY